MDLETMLKQAMAAAKDKKGIILETSNGGSDENTTISELGRGYRLNMMVLQLLATSTIPNAKAVRKAPIDVVAAAFCSGMCAAYIHSMAQHSEKLEDEITTPNQMAFPEALALSLECQEMMEAVRTALPNKNPLIEEKEKRLEKWQGKRGSS